MKRFKKIACMPISRFTIPCLILIIAPLFSAYRKPVIKENENAKSMRFLSSKDVANEKHVIDNKESFVKWSGSMAFADNHEHWGYVYISKGELIMDEDQLVGGIVEIDMNTIEYNNKLHPNSPIKHLKSPDFFDVERFPVSTFVITKVVSANSENVKVTGHLTIKDITHEVTFPAKIEVNGGIVNANGKVVIDRTQWDIRYKSAKFFSNLADETISDFIGFEMKIVAKNNHRIH
jgi:polyisoprenoid-binding protein YceI